MGGHELIWGWLLTNRSALRQIQGRPAEALEDARRAVMAKEKVLGAAHPDLAYSLNNVALCLDGLGEVAEAVESLARALPIVENGLGADHPRTAWMLSNYSELLNRVGRFAEAGDAAARALAILERESDPQGLFVTYPLVALGTSALGLGNFDRALPVLERANADPRARRSPIRRAGPRRASCWRARCGRRGRIARARCRSAPPRATSTAQSPDSAAAHARAGRRRCLARDARRRLTDRARSEPAGTRA